MICCICGTQSNLASREETLKLQKHAVQNPLPVCNDCLQLNIKLPGGGTNFVRKKQNKELKRAALKIESRRRKKKR